MDDVVSETTTGSIFHHKSRLMPSSSTDCSPSCPCCARRDNLSSDLFLPPSENDVDISTNVFDTHNHAHLTKEVPTTENDENEINEDDIVPSITCAIQPGDWEDCLDYSCSSPHRWAALGVHPWYLPALLPEPIWKDTMQRLEDCLTNDPKLLVGEVGLDAAARWVRADKQGALERQQACLYHQLQIASKYKRPVSIHCVQQHKQLLEVFQRLQQTDGLPPAMALHSFTGNQRQMEQFLEWEQSLSLETTPTNNTSTNIHSNNSTKCKLYFGFSYYINHQHNTTSASARKQHRQTIQCIQHVPLNRLLLESDLTKNVPQGIQQTLKFVAEARNMSLADLAAHTTRNARAFVQAVNSSTSPEE